DEEGTSGPHVDAGSFRRRHVAQHGVEDQHVGDEELVRNRDELPHREFRDQRREHRVENQRSRECGKEQPRQLTRARRRRHFVSHRSQNEIAAQQEKEQRERRNHRAQLARPYVDDAPQQALCEEPRLFVRVGRHFVACFAFHAASTSASRCAEMPAIFPSESAWSSSAGRVLFQSIVSFAVTASGRKVSPAANALSILRRENATLSGRSGTHTGMLDQPRIFCSVRNSAGTQMNCAPLVVTALMPYSISAIVSGFMGPVALNTPSVRFSATRIVHSAKSRESMICTGSFPVPGASTSPPLSIRYGQYVNRLETSSGPTMRPGRMIVDTGYSLCTSFSENAL